MDGFTPFDKDGLGAMHAFMELVIWCVALLVVICTVAGKCKNQRNSKFENYFLTFI